MKKNNKSKKLIKKVLNIIKTKKRFLIILALGFFMVFIIPRFFVKNKEKETVQIQKGTVSEQLILSGEIKAIEHVELYFPASGEIVWVGVKEGQIVRKGQALAKLDTLKLNADYQRALSDLRSAEASAQKALDDVKNHSADETFAQKETRTAAEVAKDKAYEAVKKAEEDLKNATLIAPFNGIVSFIAYPFSGINIIYSQRQIELVNPDTIYFEVTADQTEVGSIFQGQKVDIILDSFSDNIFEGEVENVSYTPKEEETSTVYVIKVKFVSLPLEKEKLRIGMSGDAKFILSSEENVLWIPPKFLNTDIKGKYINIGKKKIYIESGLENEDQIEISGNVKEGQIVID